MHDARRIKMRPFFQHEPCVAGRKSQVRAYGYGGIFPWPGARPIDDENCCFSSATREWRGEIDRRVQFLGEYARAETHPCNCMTMTISCGNVQGVARAATRHDLDARPGLYSRCVQAPRTVRRTSRAISRSTFLYRLSTSCATYVRHLLPGLKLGAVVASVT